MLIVRYEQASSQTAPDVIKIGLVMRGLKDEVVRTISVLHAGLLDDLCRSSREKAWQIMISRDALVGPDGMGVRQGSVDASKREIDDADVVLRLERDGLIDGGDDFAVAAAAVLVNDTQIDQIRARSHAFQRPRDHEAGGVRAVSGNDTGNVRSMSEASPPVPPVKSWL